MNWWNRFLPKAGFLIIIVSIGVFLAIRIISENRSHRHSLPHAKPRLQQWGVSAGHPLATQVGMRILNQGGNAIDAAVAVAYTLGVVEPYACGLGGGGEMVIYWSHSGQIKVIDYRETAPAIPERARRHFSSLSIGVPGLVAGLEHILEQYGTFSRAQVISPAISLADEGVPVSGTLARFLKLYEDFKITRSTTPAFYNRNRLLKTGELLRQEALAAQLTAIADQGTAAFYGGTTAETLCRAVAEAGERMSPADLSAYRPRETSPVTALFLDYEVAAPPAPGGGTPLLEMLKLSEILGVMQPGLKEELRLSLMEKVILIAYEDRLRFLGDAEAGSPTPPDLLSDHYLKKRLADLKDDPPEIGIDNEQTTTHFVVVDRDGNWVSSTQTISNFFGSGIYFNGFFLNDSLSKFSADPNSPNRIRNGKRPFSYMAPSIFLKNKKPVLAIGTPGGRRIPVIILQTLTHFLADGKSLTEAVEAPRFYLVANHELCFEKAPSQAIMRRLTRGGFQLTVGGSSVTFGSIQALAVDEGNGRLIGVADPRREGDYLIYRQSAR